MDQSPSRTSASIERERSAALVAVVEDLGSLDMAGASLTLVKLDPELTSLLEAPAEIPIRTF